MIQYAWTLHSVQQSKLEDTMTKVAEMINRGFNLCASVACSCITLDDEPVKHTYQEIPGFRVHSGPHWKTIVSSLGNDVIRVDVYVEGPVFGHEVAGAEHQMYALNLPIFQHRSGDNLS